MMSSVDNLLMFQNQYAEQVVLANMLLRQDFLEVCLEKLKIDDFSYNYNRTVFGCIKNMQKNNIPVGVIALDDYLQKTGEILNAGGQEYIYSLIENIPVSCSLESNISILKECSLRRNIFDACSRAAKVCREPGERNSSQILEDIERIITSEVVRNRPKNLASVDIQESLLNVSEKIENGTIIESGVKTQFSSLDTKLYGLKKSNLIIMAARPSMGKTTLAINIAENIALNGGKVLFISLEMSQQDIASKILSSIGNIDYEKFETGEFDEIDKRKIEEVIIKLKSAKLKINDLPNLTVLDIKSIARDTIKEFSGLDLIVIDYLGLIVPSNPLANKNEQVAGISGDLKRLSRELNVPVLCLCQINRGVEARIEKRPINADLRDSGAIEQDADVITFVFREGEYKRDSTQEEKNKTEIIISKNRRGKTGVTNLHFQGNYSRFVDDFESQRYVDNSRMANVWQREKN